MLRKFTWHEFSCEVVHRFGKNEHQSLIHKLYKLIQTGTVADYVTQFAELVDQLAAYESTTDPLHYVTRFIEGLKPSVRLLVAVQLPQDLDTTYTIALVQEEVGNGSTPLNSTPYQRHQYFAPAFSQPSSDEKQIVLPRPAPTQSQASSSTSDDRVAALKNYRRAKGLCFTCGERWFKEHKCKATVQLHVVQEMVQFLQTLDDFDTDLPSSPDDMELMHLSEEGTVDIPPAHSIILKCQVQGKPATFLLDLGSNNSFLSDKLAAQLTCILTLNQPRRVKVAGGGILHCRAGIADCSWSCGNHNFSSSFKILPLHGYDGIVGMNWLASHSPQVVDWEQKWLAFPVHGTWICLQGDTSQMYL
jgi:hypothetical protein